MRMLVVDDHLQSEDGQDVFKARLTSLPPAAARNIGEEGFRNMINNRIVQAGFELEFAFDGDEALACYRQQGPYDLVLTDFYHPGMNGIELARAILRDGFVRLRSLQSTPRRRSPSDESYLLRARLDEVEICLEFLSRVVGGRQLHEPRGTSLASIASVAARRRSLKNSERTYRTYWLRRCG